METEVIFKREKIIDKFDISKEYFYKVAEREDSPWIKIAGQWCCVVEDVVEFIRKNKKDWKGNDGKSS